MELRWEGKLPPEFTRKTIEVISKRAASLCSNPDCRCLTVGPIASNEAAAVIGEAAHIYGARPGAKRFRADLTDLQRSEITNAIWLCRNCHRLVDLDAHQYTAEVLFGWRSAHETFIASRLGRGNHGSDLSAWEFVDDSPYVRQIARERLPGWEYRLTAELLRNYLEKPLRRLKDLRSGLFVRPRRVVPEDEVFAWIGERFELASFMVEPLRKLISDELSKSWGPRGSPGDSKEIKHVCLLVRDIVGQMIDWEEAVHFTSLPPRFGDLQRHISGALGSQLEKLEVVPVELNEIVDWAEANPGKSSTFHRTIIFELPENWVQTFELKVKDLMKKKESSSGWF